MAVTKTSSRTETETFTRAEVLAAQLDYIVATTTESESFARIAELGIVENEWLEVIAVNAIDSAGNIRAKITITIDWDLHRLHVKSGKDSVLVKGDLRNSVRDSREIRKIVEYFNKKVKEKDLQAEWTAIYKKDVDRALVDKVLGMKNASAREWASGEVTHVLGGLSAQVEELAVDLSVVVPEGPGGEDITRRDTGTVIFFKDTGGFGFIRPNGGGADVFVHFSQIQSGAKSLSQGQKVSYSRAKHSKGWRAVNVRIE